MGGGECDNVCAWVLEAAVSGGACDSVCAWVLEAAVSGGACDSVCAWTVGVTLTPLEAAAVLTTSIICRLEDRGCSRKGNIILTSRGKT